MRSKHPKLLKPLLTALLSVLLALSSAVLSDDEAAAQELPWLRGGRASLDFAPSFWTWDSRYAIGPDGSSLVQPLGAWLTADPLGSEIIPSLRPLETALATALDNPIYRVRLGTSTAALSQSRLTFPLRLDVGITDWLTVGAMVPFVRPRMEITFALDADSLSADMGVSPRSTSPSSVTQFLSQFQSTLDGAADLHGGDPDFVAAQEYLAALTTAYDQESFFPVAGSAAGRLLQERLERLRAALQGLGIAGIPATIPLADAYLDQEAFDEFVSSTTGGLGAAPLEDWTTLWSMGDVELTAALRLLSGGFEPDSAGNLPLLRYQLGTGFLARLGTGQQADPNRFFEQDPADGQNDFEGNAFALVQVGDHLGAWGTFRYGLQQEGEVIRRIAAPSEALPGRNRLARLKWTPGNYTELDLNPRFYLNPAMTFGVRYHYWDKKADSYELLPPAPDQPIPESYPPASLLDLETRQTLREIGFTATFSSLGAADRGEASIPVYLRATYFRPLDGSGGRTPKGGRFVAGVTIYRTFWGRQPRQETTPAEAREGGGSSPSR